MKKTFVLLLSLFVICLSSTLSFAQNCAVNSERENPNHLFLGASYVNLSRVQDAYYDIRAEYHFDNKVVDLFRQFLGFTYSTKQDAYFFAGTGAEIFFNKSLYVFPSLSVGFFKQGKGVELGYPVEFREGIELVWKATKNNSVFLGIFHMSNAQLSHLKNKPNPGQEMLSFGVTIPVFRENQLD